MKLLRTIAPGASLAISLVVLSFTFGGPLLSGNPKNDSGSHGQLASNPPTANDLAGLARQASDGEVEDVISDDRNKGNFTTLIGILLQSRTISDFVPIIQSRLAIQLTIGPPLVILLGQFLI